MGNQEIRLPPQNLDAERAVLGAMLIDDDAIGTVLERLDSSFFYELGHQKIYEGIVHLYADRKNVDLITLTDRLMKSDAILRATLGSNIAANMFGSPRNRRPPPPGPPPGPAVS